MGCTNSRMFCVQSGDDKGKLEGNVSEHRTDIFEWDGLVFRRGQPFVFKLPVKLGVSHDVCRLEMVLKTTGYKPVEYRISNHNSTNPSGWYLHTKKDNNPNHIFVRLTTPIDVPIGSYYGLVYFNHTYCSDIYFTLLFNPWNPNDSTYLPSDEKLKEYVLSTKTLIYMGTQCSIISKEWYLGQFKRTSIEAAIYLLNRIASVKRSNPIDVCRALSALVNSNDDNGVLVGNWSGSYLDGVDPNTWIGSAEILRKYVKSKQPVRYGQCWVFSGVLCSVLRCIGLPTRCVTNYQSFHDSDGSMQWEIYFDENFNLLNISTETCWNYHCWNEVWMKREDLGNKFDGWQIVDATPQERSYGLFQLGPASRYAVSKGFIGAKYDTGFVFAEVSADRIYYVKQHDGKFKHYLTEKGEVGKYICTKKIGCKERKDLTRFYKDCLNDEKTDIETTSVNDCLFNETNRHKPTQPITININTVSDYKLGSELTCSVCICGLTDDEITSAKMKVHLVSYHGKHLACLLNKPYPVNKTNGTFSLTINSVNIQEKMTPACSYIKCSVTCLTHDDQFAHKEMLINVFVPRISFGKVPDAIYIGEPLKIGIRIHNPLSVPLTQVKVYIECDAILRRQTYKFDDIEPYETLRHKIVLVMRLGGYKTIFANMKCKEFTSLSNSTEIVVIRKYIDPSAPT